MRPVAALCAVLLAGLLVTRSVQAQCGANHSSCSACHDGVRASAPSHEAWHDDHAFADVCATCHGGRGDASDLAAAHVGLVEPLANVEEQCGSCHGASTQALADRYRSTRLVDKDAGAATGESSGAARDSNPRPPSVTKPRPHGEPGANVALTVVIGAIGALGVGFIARQERGRGHRATRPVMPTVSSV